MIDEAVPCFGRATDRASGKTPRHDGGMASTRFSRDVSQDVGLGVISKDDVLDQSSYGRFSAEGGVRSAVVVVDEPCRHCGGSLRGCVVGSGVEPFA